jgi:hypothetical protein
MADEITPFPGRPSNPDLTQSPAPTLERGVVGTTGEADLERICAAQAPSPELKVVPLRPVHDAETVEWLEWALAEAKAGRLTGLAVVAHQNDGTCITNILGAAHNDVIRTVGATAILHERALRSRVVVAEERPQP